jgi:hypothetical protein
MGENPPRLAHHHAYSSCGLIAVAVCCIDPEAVFTIAASSWAVKGGLSPRCWCLVNLSRVSAFWLADKRAGARLVWSSWFSPPRLIPGASSSSVGVTGSLCYRTPISATGCSCLDHTITCKAHPLVYGLLVVPSGRRAARFFGSVLSFEEGHVSGIGQSRLLGPALRTCRCELLGLGWVHVPWPCSCQQSHLLRRLVSWQCLCACV